MTRVPVSRSEVAFERPAGTVLAYRGSAPLTHEDLRHAAAAILDRLRDAPAGEWGVHLGSPFMLLAALTALQASQRAAVLLPHARPAFLERMAGQLDGLLLDQAHPGAVQVPQQAEPTSGTAPVSLPRWSTAVGLLTSGSSGAPVCVWKTPDELIAEIEMLETAFGAEIAPERVVCGTTSHQHLYGFSFRVMWPYLTGRALADGQIRIPGEIATATRQHERIVLVSSPAFLERAEALLDLDALGRARFIGFSSGGPLGAATARRFNRTSGCRLIEIYGSTETGALASRITREQPPAPWQPLPGVQVDSDGGLLRVSADHLAGCEPVTTSDRVEILPDGFLLKGRSDQLVKVADKRVSLTELNELLEAHPDMARARTLPLDDATLAAAVVPTSEGWESLIRLGKDAFCRALRDHLSERVDRVTTPKRWRILRRLPVNDQGKIALEDLRRQFERPETELPWVVDEATPDRWTASAAVDANLAVLDGHFPGNPIVPGVAQVHWAALAARAAFGVEASGNMETIKFRRPIVPGTTLTLTLTLDRSRGKVGFEFADADQVYSSGRLLLESS